MYVMYVICIEKKKGKKIKKKRGQHKKIFSAVSVCPFPLFPTLTKKVELHRHKACPTNWDSNK